MHRIDASSVAGNQGMRAQVLRLRLMSASPAKKLQVIVMRFFFPASAELFVDLNLPALKELAADHRQRHLPETASHMVNPTKAIV